MRRIPVSPPRRKLVFQRRSVADSTPHLDAPTDVQRSANIADPINLACEQPGPNAVRHEMKNGYIPERLLTREEVEELFGFPTKRYLELSSVRGDGPPELRFGRLVRYKVSDVAAWIDEHKVLGEDPGHG